MTGDLINERAPATQHNTGFLFRRRWETRAAAALALERVGRAVAPSALAQALFGADSVGDGEAGIVGGSLLSLEGLDLGRVLRDGEPLLASTGEVRPPSTLHPAAQHHTLHDTQLRSAPLTHPPPNP